MPISRRQFVIASTFTAGFALAVQQIANSVIQTSSNNLVSGSISIPSSTGAFPAYYAAPAKGEGFPVVLVIQEIFGVHEHIRDVVRRFARLGYVAIAKGQSGSSIIVYPDAPHAFFADYRPNYRQKDAQDGWKRLQAWFKAKGVTTI